MMSHSSRTDEEDEIGYENDLSAKNMDIELNTDTSNWSATDKKKLQYMAVSYRISTCLWRGSLN